MAGKQLKRYVSVGGTTYKPGAEVPKGDADQIDNPKAYEERDDTTPAEAVAREQSNRALDSNLKPVGK